MADTNHYALAKLGECARALTVVIGDMPGKRQSIEKQRAKGRQDKAKETYGELKALHERLLRDMQNVRLLLLETELDDMAAYTGKLYDALKGFNLLTNDYTKFAATVNGFIAQLPAQETTNASIIGRLMANVKIGYYPTDLAHVAILQKAVVFPAARVNLLDPCCGCGLALETLARHQNAVTYGVEIDAYRREEAQTRLDRAAFGSYFHARISHETFHLMLLNPPYLSVMRENGGNARSEKLFLADSLYHLMYGGVLLYIIPYYRLTADICRLLCDNFTDLRVFRFMPAEFGKFKQAVVIGTRRKRADGGEEAETLMQYALNPGKIPWLDTIQEGLYPLPDTEKQVALFNGADFNVNELAEQLKKSKSIDRLFEKNKPDAMEKRPLLPLNIGQVGLIGGSGLINGLVACDTPHIIKGRVVKQVKVEEDIRFDQEGNFAGGEIKETRVNRMVFNILTPDGFRSLA
jgi:methylase of polypeptide subunit release factors